MLLHRLEQRRLRLRRRAVDLIGKDHVSEYGTGHEGQFSPAFGVLQNFRARDVGRHEVGRKLDTAEFEVKHLRDGLHKERFRESRRTGNQTVSAGEQREHDLLDDLTLADDHLGQFGFDPAAAGEKFLGGFTFGREGVGGGVGASGNGRKEGREIGTHINGTSGKR